MEIIICSTIGALVVPAVSRWKRPNARFCWREVGLLAVVGVMIAPFAATPALIMSHEIH